VTRLEVEQVDRLQPLLESLTADRAIVMCFASKFLVDLEAAGLGTYLATCHPTTPGTML
jgi:hypothetical protein